MSEMLKVGDLVRVVYDGMRIYHVGAIGRVVEGPERLSFGNACPYRVEFPDGERRSWMWHELEAHGNSCDVGTWPFDNGRKP